MFQMFDKEIKEQLSNVLFGAVYLLLVHFTLFVVLTSKTPSLEFYALALVFLFSVWQFATYKLKLEFEEKVLGKRIGECV